VWDVDGNEFIDWTAALCAMSLGYGYHSVVDAATVQAAYDGNVFGLPSALETECAEQFTRMTGYDMVRFGKNGSDATSAAVRLARAVTGGEYIVKMKGHYHGCADWAQAWNPRCKGIPWGVKHGVLEIPYGMTDCLDYLCGAFN
jgi:glutamate-1-semialdehyde 2,1-aminomutase